MLTFATEKLSTGANGQEEPEDAASFFCHGPRSFDRLSCHRRIGSGPAYAQRVQASWATRQPEVPVSGPGPGLSGSLASCRSP